MKWIYLSVFMIILVACTSHPNSSGGTSRNKPADVSGIMKRLTPRIESPAEEKSSMNGDRSYQEAIKKFQVPVHHYSVDAQIDNEIIVGNRGTVLHIPKDIMVDRNGNLYLGNANIHFKEYTNSAEIAFSGIPMTYNNGKEVLRFNSAGMFELTATSTSGEELFIGRGKSISVDYKLVQENPGTDFYRFDESTNQWVRLSGIIQPFKRDSFMTVEVVSYLRSWEQVATKVDGIRTVTLERVPVYGRSTRDTLIRLENGRITNVSADYITSQNSLNVPRFGMYNCDQVFRLRYSASVIASYINKENGKELKDLATLSMIDLNRIAAFSFPPNQFTFDPSARNVLLLFTEKGELYFLDEKSFKAMRMQNNGSYRLPMINVSEQVKNTNDLQLLLNL